MAHTRERIKKFLTLIKEWPRLGRTHDGPEISDNRETGSQDDKRQGGAESRFLNTEGNGIITAMEKDVREFLDEGTLNIIVWSPENTDKVSFCGVRLENRVYNFVTNIVLQEEYREQFTEHLAKKIKNTNKPAASPAEFARLVVQDFVVDKFETLAVDLLLHGIEIDVLYDICSKTKTNMTLTIRSITPDIDMEFRANKKTLEVAEYLEGIQLRKAMTTSPVLGVN